MQACAALCREKGWERAVVLHEGGAGVAARLARELAPAPLALLARQLPPGSDSAALRYRRATHGCITTRILFYSHRGRFPAETCFWC